MISLKSRALTVFPICLCSHEDEQPGPLSPLASSTTSSAVMVEHEPESESEPEHEPSAVGAAQPDDASSATGSPEQRHADQLPADDSSSSSSGAPSLSESVAQSLPSFAPSFAAGKLLVRPPSEHQQHRDFAQRSVVPSWQCRLPPGCFHCRHEFARALSTASCQGVKLNGFVQRSPVWRAYFHDCPSHLDRDEMQLSKKSPLRK